MEAFKAFMRLKFRVVSWDECQAIMSAFGICKSFKEVRKIVGEIGFTDDEYPKRHKFKKIEKDDSQEAR